MCLACARVKYFDSKEFEDIVCAVKAHLRSYMQLKAESHQHIMMCDHMNYILYMNIISHIKYVHNISLISPSII